MYGKWLGSLKHRQQEHFMELPIFLQRLAVLISEGYSFAESVMMLLPHHVENASEKQREVQERLHNGEGVMGVMTALEIPSHYLISIAIAEHNGHLQEALAGIAKQMQFSMGIRRRFQKLMLYPLALLLFLIVLFVMFRIYFFPNIERMIESRGGSSDEGSLWISRMLLSLPDYGVIFTLVICILFFSSRYILLKQSIDKQLAVQLKIPIWNRYFRLLLTSAFSKYLGSLLVSGFSLQSSLEVLEKQNYQLYLQLCAIQLREKIVHGESLVQGIEGLMIFQKDFVVFIEHGENSGYLGKELMLYSELLEERLEEKIRRLLTIVQPSLFVVIALCVIAAYLSILLPIYSMIDFI